ncbi:MAG: 50S ribosomal protein L2 [Candidatus Diapherotrites archaeon]|nr:50S ribosomal protein L2 [Candidatus Diapherotrites archaeon]
MAQRTRTQRAGKGSPTYKASMNAKAKSGYLTLNDVKDAELIRGRVSELFIDQLHSGVLAKVNFENGKEVVMLAAEGLSVGQNIELGKKAALSVGNVLPLREIVEGAPVFCVEKTPGDGGVLIKSSGLYGLVMTKDSKTVFVKLPSGQTVQLNPGCRATIGCGAGSGRGEKPLVKAGAAFHKMRAKHHKYPSVRGVAMNPLSHPFGGGQHHAGKSKSTSRHAPPGRKVGAIASKRTGRLKK